ncbi:BON domain-containing protein [Streptomyces tsukubensis]|uniref:LysM domain-containing protein n=1 Tax=Streptomyces tsukubensis TaxID=83656 RepID=A0A1V4AA70_9ACTN|nr:BON domain-containing protein [Streptomyces tsukubensis]OON80674.1 hypothetical protein B1H18_12490 [Streptomyces tsukubensis]QFR96338.1 BON domain-containing protein [Streptomyces tsukubensis]
MTMYEFDKSVGQPLDAPLHGEGAEAAKQLKHRLEALGLTHDHFLVEVDGSKVTVSGDAAMQDQKERILLALGNTEGVAQVEDLVDAGQEELRPRFVTVRDGETLSDLAERLYGDPNAGANLLRANEPMVSSLDQVCGGWVLRAPA